MYLCGLCGQPESALIHGPVEHGCTIFGAHHRYTPRTPVIESLSPSEPNASGPTFGEVKLLISAECGSPDGKSPGEYSARQLKMVQCLIARYIEAVQLLGDAFQGSIDHSELVTFFEQDEIFWVMWEGVEEKP